MTRIRKLYLGMERRLLLKKKIVLGKYVTLQWKHVIIAADTPVFFLFCQHWEILMDAPTAHTVRRSSSAGPLPAETHTCHACCPLTWSETVPAVWKFVSQFDFHTIPKFLNIYVNCDNTMLSMAVCQYLLNESYDSVTPVRRSNGRNGMAPFRLLADSGAVSGYWWQVGS